MAWNNDCPLRKNNQTIVVGDGQVSLGNTVLKSKAKKVERLRKKCNCRFCGIYADAYIV